MKKVIGKLRHHKGAFNSQGLLQDFHQGKPAGSHAHRPESDVRDTGGY